MKYEDKNKKFEIVYSGIETSNGVTIPKFRMNFEKPVNVETYISISDLSNYEGLKCIYFSSFSAVAEAANGGKGGIYVTIPDDVSKFIIETSNEELEKAKKEALANDPEQWFIAIGGDTHSVYATPDHEYKELRDDLTEIKKSLEGLMWSQRDLERMGKKTDMKTCLYTETGWYSVPHSEILKIYEKIEREREEKKTAKENRVKSIFEKARKTGEPQIIEDYFVECDDPEFECTDVIEICAMPDGSRYSRRRHTF